MNDMGNADLSVNPGLNMLMVTEPFAERVSPMDVKIRSDHPSLQTEVALHATTPKGVTTPGAATWINDKVIIEGKALTYGYVNQPMDVKGYTNHAPAFKTIQSTFLLRPLVGSSAPDGMIKCIGWPQEGPMLQESLIDGNVLPSEVLPSRLPPGRIESDAQGTSPRSSSSELPKEDTTITTEQLCMMRDHYPSVLTELGDDLKEDQEVHNPVNKGNVVPQEGIWTSWVELSNGGAVSPSEVLPSSNSSGRVVGNAIGYPPRRVRGYHHPRYISLASILRTRDPQVLPSAYQH